MNSFLIHKTTRRELQCTSFWQELYGPLRIVPLALPSLSILHDIIIHRLRERRADGVRLGRSVAGHRLCHGCGDRHGAGGVSEPSVDACGGCGGSDDRCGGGGA